MKENRHFETEENIYYHDMWTLLRRYRDIVQSLELSVKLARHKFQIEYGGSIEDFLASAFLADVDFSDFGIDEHAKSIERSHRMLKMVENAVNLLRTKHKFGEAYYWILYYTFLSPQRLKNTDEIIERLRPHIPTISYRVYYRQQKEAINALSSILWGYSSRDSLKILQDFFPDI